MPWGISESAYAFTDRAGNYQYRAFGVPGLGLKRGLADDLVVAPYATALASLIDPAAAAENFERLAARGLDGRFGFYEALDYRPAQPRRRRAPPETAASPADRARVLRASPGHVARRARQRHLQTTPSSRASTPTRACRRPSCCCRSGCRARRSCRSRGRPRAHRRRRRCRCSRRGASARRTRRARTRSSSRTAATPPRSPTPAAASAPGATWR